MTVVAALYVQRGGVYDGRADVECWDEARDARNYAGPHPVVAHPPCAAWCRLAHLRELWHGLPVGEDGGTFAHALAMVRQFGGALEHPADTKAWNAHELRRPPPVPGWHPADFDGGWCTEIQQAAYGHRAAKRTWLYAVAQDLPRLDWQYRSAEAPGSWCDSSAHRNSERNSATPPAFAELLLAIARG